MTSRPLAAIARPLIVFLCFYLGFIAPYNGGASAPSSPAAVTAITSDDPKYIALTFDDGPGGEYTDMILDHLEACGARGTFFIMGCRINDNLPQIKRMIEGGHQLGNHTWDHVDLTKTDKDATLRQIMSVHDSIKGLFGVSPQLVRPPYGFFDENARGAGFPLIHWSVDTMDWHLLDADAVVRHILENARDGDIILMHDIYPSTAEAVGRVLPLLDQKGFRMVTVSELFAIRGIALEPGKAYYCAR